MKESDLNRNSNNFDNEIDFRKFFYILINGKWIIVSVTGFISTIFVIYSLFLPNIYESKALLAPVNPSSSISGALQSYSSIAGIAGINIPSDSDAGNSERAIQKIGSLSFFQNNILPNIHLPDLMAFEAWDPRANKVAYDVDSYDTNSGAWNRDFSYPQQQIPSAQESFEIFTKQHLSLSKDKKSGFITLSIKHQSPYLAKEWVELVVDEVNNYYRQKDKLESEKAVSYLNQQISMTGLSEIKEVLAGLLQEEIKQLTLIEANKFYVFDYIDFPAVMEKKSEPNRVLICILGALLGGIFSIFIVLIRHNFKPYDATKIL